MMDKTECAPEKKTNIREQLADYAHEAWSGWMKYMFEKMTINDDGTATMPKWAVDRWTFQMNKTYNELPEDMKESDRQEADRMVAIVQEKTKRGKNGRKRMRSQ